EQQPVLGEAELARVVGLAAAHPPHRGDRALEGAPHRVDCLYTRGLCTRAAARRHAATAVSTAASSSWTSCSGCAARARRSARSSTRHGMNANAASPAEAQNATP